MAIIQPSTLVIAEMITHDFIWHGAGATCDEAREALLSAWARHRGEVTAQFPQLEATLPPAGKMQSHFKITYREYERGGGYRGDDRLV
ncbi:hypothetical protein [Azohydromonas lata]|uniref:Uncharacterized protein n=1 Tax=Azohydromonas lata TaxID=45677 RepID=A0ABU5IR17_9BURK|nr:hypothetical protein [Azohydromonas lata]MDZ5461339.1 hypothetical protein [Azohydromonas lata]